MTAGKQKKFRSLNCIHDLPAWAHCLHVQHALLKTISLEYIVKYMQEGSKVLHIIDTADSNIRNLDSNISVKSKPYSKILQHVNQGLGLVSLTTTKIGCKNRVTLSL